jgi:hypothetical protein
MAKQLAEPQKSVGGRPKSAEPLVPVTTWVKPSEYDKLCRTALKHDQKLSVLVRSLLILRLP